MLYPQNGDRIVAIDSVTSLHPTHKVATIQYDPVAWTKLDNSRVQVRTTYSVVKEKVKFSHTRYRALGLELIPVYRQSARR